MKRLLVLDNDKHIRIADMIIHTPILYDALEKVYHNHSYKRKEYKHLRDCYLLDTFNQYKDDINERFSWKGLQGSKCNIVAACRYLFQ